MGKISNYASALKAKLTDYFVIASDNNGVLETKKVTTEQIGDAIASDQTHSLLDTSDKTLIGGINENVSSIGTLSSLTTTDKSSLVGAVNSIYPTKDIGGTAKGVSGTYQIPAGVLSHSIITIALRRYAYAGEVTILAENITAGAYTNGLTVFGAHDKYAEFSISTTGLITITAIQNWAEVYIDLIGIF